MDSCSVSFSISLTLLLDGGIWVCFLQAMSSAGGSGRDIFCETSAMI